MARYGLATIFGSYPVGYEFTADNLPLHLTHVDSFEVALGPEELAANLQTALAHQQAFSVKALRDEFYGPEKDIPVTVLELTPELVELHTRIMDMLDAAGATLKNPHFHREFFAPHISIYGLRRVALGEEIPISDISIAAKVGEGDDAPRRILATVMFA